jgi:hypothetical protein
MMNQGESERESMMYRWHKRRADQVSGGIFLIGLGLMFAKVLPWWPGIMYVAGAAAIAQGFAEGKRGYALMGGVWLIGLGLLFSVGFSWPLLLILIGASMLFRNLRGQSSDSVASERRDQLLAQSEKAKREKAKNDNLARSNEYDDPEDVSYMLGDDGELIKVEPDHKTPRARQF